MNVGPVSGSRKPRWSARFVGGSCPLVRLAYKRRRPCSHQRFAMPAPLCFCGRSGLNAAGNLSFITDKYARLSYLDDSIEVRTTDEFNEWLCDLRDIKGRARILVRINRIEEGNSAIPNQLETASVSYDCSSGLATGSIIRCKARQLPFCSAAATRARRTEISSGQRRSQRRSSNGYRNEAV